MAITHVAGQVTRTFFDGKGAEVTESWESNGERMTKRWSAFFDQPHGLSEGDQVEVSGMHSDKIDEWVKDGETRRAVKRTLNRARVKDGNGSEMAPADDLSPFDGSRAPADDPWPAVAPLGSDEEPWTTDLGSYSEQTPF